MTAKPKAVFLDANTFVYALDKTSDLHDHAVKIIQRLLEEKVPVCTSHHVVEEVLHIVQKISQSGVTPIQVVEEIDQISDLLLIEPAANLDFAKRYAALSERVHAGVNDALILQLMLDADITRLFSYDKKLLKQAHTLHIEQIT
jgi:predicted nucleic acid-binding protein